jgi:putative transposase
MIFAYQIALDLTAEQEAYCRRAAGIARFAYRWALPHWKQPDWNGEKPTAEKLKNQWNAIKHDCYSWVADVHKDANQQPFTHIETAFIKFFRHEAGYPTFKKKGQHDSFYISNDKYTVQGKRFRILRLGWVHMWEALRFTGTLLSVVVSRIVDRWFASFAVRLDVAPSPYENQAGIVGVDLGVLTLATLSTEEKITGPKPLRKLLQALRRCSKSLSRRVKGANN